MTAPLTLADLVAALENRIGLRYLQGEQAAQICQFQTDASGELPSVGHLNLIRPHQIQVIGAYESAFLMEKASAMLASFLASLTRDGCCALVFTEGTTPKPLQDTLPTLLASRILLETASGSHEVIALFRHLLQQRLAHSQVRHGVFLEIFGTGVLLTGHASVGKSEVALELISRGHRLVADDAPEFARVAPDVLRGSCPALLRDLLEVRGLGVLNIRAMYGDSAIKRGKFLRLVIHLRTLDHPTSLPEDRLNGCRGEVEILGLHIPMVELPVAPGRNIAVMIEAAVRAHLLHQQGYLAGEDLGQRLRQQLQVPGHPT